MACAAGDERWSLDGMTALVTGGTKGIGCAIVEELARLGASVHTCSRNEIELGDRLKDWAAKGFRVTGSICDVSSRAQREKLMETVSEVFSGKLHVLVNNVATSIYKPTVDCSAEDFSTIVATNFESTFHLCQLSHPLLKASGAGCIVNVSSLAGVVALRVSSAYASTKGAMNQLTKNLACEWAKDSIRVNAVAPGFTRTPFTEKRITEESFQEDLKSRTPLRRVGEPEDISAVVAFLCLPASCYVTGQIICVDGGMSANGFFPTD
ncbi:hypothetical protein Nepgr_020149 [Nepenthes gracilis]|uniref:Uncharacterized protein n=1 Tax=Nepenthes gracilis TaxID=150966 RepID=A0AAD3SVF5_NEPGR|nr:hypothetical protein Nepgr_020149 [Nepenthes gracilis]